MKNLPAVTGGIIPIDQEKVEKAYATKNGLKGLMEKFKEKALEEKALLPDDMSFAKNRKAYKSLGAAIGKDKATLERLAKNLADTKREDIKGVTAEIAAINANKKDVSEFLKELRLEIPKEAVGWEKTEEERKTALEDRVKEIEQYGENCRLSLYADKPSADIKADIEKLEGIEIDDSFGELKHAASITKSACLTDLRKALGIQEREERKAVVEKEIQRIRDIGNSEGSVEELKKYAGIVCGIVIVESCYEFTDKIQPAIDAAFKNLEKSIELEELKEEKEKREEQDRLDKLQREADERAATKERKKNLQDTADAVELETNRKKAIRGRIQEIKQLSMNVVEMSADAIQARLDILLGYEITDDAFIEFREEALEAQAAVKEILESSLRAAQAREKEKKKEDDAKVLKKQREKEAEEQRERQADAANKKKVDDEIKEDLLKLGLDGLQIAKFILRANLGGIRNVNIKY